MKPFSALSLILVMLLVTVSFSQCASTKKLQSKAPLDLGDVYYEHWVAGVKGGGSGFNIFIPISNNPNHIMLDSVYFRGRGAKLEYKNKSVFVGRFKTEANQKQDIIMSSDPMAEYGNRIPDLPIKTPFELKETECIVGYKEDKITKYFKISNITKKKTHLYRSAFPNTQ